jgi:hypothetical protein
MLLVSVMIHMTFHQHTNLHDMSPYEFVQAHVHVSETMVVPYDDNTDDRKHDNNDLYDASYDMDPFDIGSAVGTIQAYTFMDEKGSVFKDKWSSLNQKTKKLWGKTDDNDK